jgi:hypothetical protein
VKFRGQKINKELQAQQLSDFVMVASYRVLRVPLQIMIRSRPQHRAPHVRRAGAEGARASSRPEDRRSVLARAHLLTANGAACG